MGFTPLMTPKNDTCDGKYSTFVARVTAREEGRGRCAAKLHRTRGKDKAE